VPQLFAFLRITQPEAFKRLGMVDANDTRDISRLKFLARLSAEIGKRGVIDVLRKGIEHGPLHFDLFYGTPSPGNAKAAALHARTGSAVTRQLRYSMDETRRALDLCLFINGLPVATFELKNSLTKQTVEDAVEQYKRDRDPRERCSSSAAASCTSPWTTSRCACAPNLKGKASWFLPFNKGWNDGAGNPPNPNGLKTDYLWKQSAHAGGPDRHPRELRAGRRGRRPAHGQEEAQADLPALPPARRGAAALADVARTGRAGAT
jgi:type I restriction enzyme R subunit